MSGLNRNKWIPEPDSIPLVMLHYFILPPAFALVNWLVLHNHTHLYSRLLFKMSIPHLFPVLNGAKFKWK